MQFLRVQNLRSLQSIKRLNKRREFAAPAGISLPGTRATGCTPVKHANTRQHNVASAITSLTLRWCPTLLQNAAQM